MEQSVKVRPAAGTAVAAPVRPGLKNFRFPQRRKKEPTREEKAEAQRQIAEFIASKGVTVCKPGWAVGVIPSQYEF